MSEQKIYAVHQRVSTDMQAEDGESMDMQETLAKELIEREGGTLYKEYLEPALSASKTRLANRPELMRLLNDAREGKFTHLIAYRRDRLFRNAEESIVVRNILKKAGIQVVFTAKGEQPMDFDDMYATLMENIRATLDEIESIQTSIRVSDTMANKAKRGEFTGGIVPYGYEHKDGYLIPIESEIPVIKEIEDLYMQGFGFSLIGKWLDGHEVEGLGKRSSPAIRLKQHKAARSYWTKGVVKGILFNATYSGYMVYSPEGEKARSKGDFIEVKSEFIVPIRSEETQLKLNMIKQRKMKSMNTPKRYNTPFLLTGILYCQECGYKYYSRTTQRANGTRYSYYLCEGKNRDRQSKTCTSKQYKKEILEEFVLEEAKKHTQSLVDSNVYEIVRKGMKSKEDELEAQLKDLQAAIKLAEKDLQAIKRLLYELDVDSPVYEMLKSEYTSDQTDLLIKLMDMKKTQTSIEENMRSKTEETLDMEGIIKQLKDFNEGVDIVPNHIKKQMLDNLFKKILIDANGFLTLTPAFVTQDTNEGFKEKGEEVISVIGKGSLGTPTLPLPITLDLEADAYRTSFFDWIETLISTVKETFFEYILERYPELKKQKKFTAITGYSKDTHYRLSKKHSVPGYETMINILKICGSSVEEYSMFINKEGIPCSPVVLEKISQGRTYVI